MTRAAEGDCDATELMPAERDSWAKVFGIITAYLGLCIATAAAACLIAVLIVDRLHTPPGVYG